MIRLRLSPVIVSLFLAGAVLLAQKREEKPKLHSDFHFGSYPVSRAADAIMSRESARLLFVGFHQGWDIEKIARESKQAEEDLERTFADLEDARLLFEEDLYSRRPLLPVIRDRDIERIQPDLIRHTAEFTKVLESKWAEIETAAASLSGAESVPKAQLLYQIVVGGILFGAMQEAFFEDQTLMVRPPRRASNDRFYAWLVESDAGLAGFLKRDEWESEGYTIVSIGRGLAESRAGLDRIRASKGMLLEQAEARRFRSFVTIFAKDNLLPYFKTNRSGILKVLNEFDAGRYVRVADAFAWYYDQIANGVASALTASGRIQAPDGHYAFALKASTR